MHVDLVSSRTTIEGSATIAPHPRPLSPRGRGEWKETLSRQGLAFDPMQIKSVFVRK